MGLFKKKFYDKYWNFNNDKFVELLTEARKKQNTISNKKNKKSWSFEIRLFESVSSKEVWQFINKFWIFLNSWIDVKWALNILVKQIKNPYLKRIVIEIKDNIDHWIAINETMSSYPKVFDNLTVSLVKVWEKTWKLSQILDELDTTMLENIELKAKVKWAMIYPAILLILTLVMVIFMMIFIVPRVTDSFASAWASLPKPTQVILNISRFIWGFTKSWEEIQYIWNVCNFTEFEFVPDPNNPRKTLKNPVRFFEWKTQIENWQKSCHVSSKWIYIVFLLILLIIVYKLINKTYLWKSIFSKIAINLPIFGFVVRQSNVVYFIKSFTILLDSWVLLLESLKVSSQVVWNLAYKRELIRIKNEVEVWLPISKSLWLNLEYESSVYINKLFTEEFAYVIATWEETWTLSTSLKKMWRSYNWELKRYIWNLSTMMEPVIIIIVWFLVGAIIIAIMMPFFEMGSVAQNL